MSTPIGARMANGWLQASVGLVTLLVVLGFVFEAPRDRLEEALRNEAAPVELPETSIAVGSFAFVTPNSVYLATLVYAKGDVAVSTLNATLRDLAAQAPYFPNGTPPDLRRAVCENATCPVARSGQDMVLASLHDALTNMTPAGAILGNASGEIVASRDALVLIQVAKLGRAAEETPRDLDAATASLDALQTRLHGACKNVTQADACDQLLARHAIVAEWDSSLQSHADLERYAGTAVFGPLTWRAVEGLALELPPEVFRKGEPLALEADGEMFVPTRALVAVMAAVLLSVFVNPLARKAGLEPFLPTPLLALLWGVGVLVLIHKGYHIGGAATTTAVAFGVFFTLVGLTYLLVEAPVLHRFSGVLSAIAVGLAAALFIDSFFDRITPGPDDLLVLLYEEGPRAKLQALHADALYPALLLALSGLLLWGVPLGAALFASLKAEREGRLATAAEDESEPAWKRYAYRRRLVSLARQRRRDAIGWWDEAREMMARRRRVATPRTLGPTAMALEADDEGSAILRLDQRARALEGEATALF